MNRIITIHCHKKNVFYYAAYCMYVIYMFYLRSNLGSLPALGFLSKGLRLLCVLLLFFYTIMSIRTPMLRLKEFTAIVVFSAVFLLTCFKGNYTSLVFNFLFLILGVAVNFDEILQILEKTIIVCFIFVLLLCAIGVLKDNVFYHSTLGRNAHTLGFSYYSFPQATLTLALLIRLFRKSSNCTWIDYIVTLMISYIAYYIFTTRLYFIETIAFVLMFILVYKLKFLQFTAKLWKYIAILGYPSCCILTYYLAVNFTYSNPTLYAINEIMSGRLDQMNKALNVYPVGFLSQNIVMVGTVQVTNGNVDYLYIDSGYMYSLTAYGIIFSIMIILLYSMLFYHAYKTNDKSVYIWLTIMMFLNLSNDFIVAIITNPLIFLAVKSFYENNVSHNRLIIQMKGNIKRTFNEWKISL